MPTKYPTIYDRGPRPCRNPECKNEIIGDGRIKFCAECRANNMPNKLYERRVTRNKRLKYLYEFGFKPR